MNKYVIKTLNTIHVIIRPAKDSIFPHLARRLEKLPTPDIGLLAYTPEQVAVSKTNVFIVRSITCLYLFEYDLRTGNV